MIIGRITAKAQTTIPRAVRRALGLRAGDAISYEIENERVILRRAGNAIDQSLETFTEWADELDAAYDGL